MKNNFEEIYEGRDTMDNVEALLGMLKRRNEEVYDYACIHHYSEYEKINNYVLNTFNVLKKVQEQDGTLESSAFAMVKEDIQKQFDYLDKKEKEERRRRIRNGVTFGIGALLAPTGIPAAIIVSKKLKEAFGETGD